MEEGDVMKWLKIQIAIVMFAMSFESAGQTGLYGPDLNTSTTQGPFYHSPISPITPQADRDNQLRKEQAYRDGQLYLQQQQLETLEKQNEILDEHQMKLDN